MVDSTSLVKQDVFELLEKLASCSWAMSATTFGCRRSNAITNKMDVTSPNRVDVTSPNGVDVTSPNGVGGGRMEPSATFGRGLELCRRLKSFCSVAYLTCL